MYEFKRIRIESNRKNSMNWIVVVNLIPFLSVDKNEKRQENVVWNKTSNNIFICDLWYNNNLLDNVW